MWGHVVGDQASDRGFLWLCPEFLHVGVCLRSLPIWQICKKLEKGWIREKDKRNSLFCRAIFDTFNHLATCESANGNLRDCNWNRHRPEWRGGCWCGSLVAYPRQP